MSDNRHTNGTPGENSSKNVNPEGADIENKTSTSRPEELNYNSSTPSPISSKNPYAVDREAENKVSGGTDNTKDLGKPKLSFHKDEKVSQHENTQKSDVGKHVEDNPSAQKNRWTPNGNQDGTAFGSGEIQNVTPKVIDYTTYSQPQSQQKENSDLDEMTGKVPMNGNSWVAAVFLAGILGMFGAHRFYIGDEESGKWLLGLTIVGLITSFILIGFIPLTIATIWGLIDFIMILLRKGDRWAQLR